MVGGLNPIDKEEPKSCKDSVKMILNEPITDLALHLSIFFTAMILD